MMHNILLHKNHLFLEPQFPPKLMLPQNSHKYFGVTYRATLNALVFHIAALILTIFWVLEQKRTWKLSLLVLIKVTPNLAQL